MFCFLLAAELTLGSLSTPAQAEASEITTPETEKGAEASEITTLETKAEEAAEPTDSTPPPEKTEGEPEANEQKQETTEPEEPNPPDTENTCICRSRCDNDNVNKECLVCAGGPDKCTYEEEPPADEQPTEEPPVEEPLVEEPPQCTCIILCTEDSIDTGCPVCVEDSSLCTPVTVTEEAPQVQLLSDLEEEPNPLADEPSAEQCICTTLCTEGNIIDACTVCTKDRSLCMAFQDETEGTPRLYYRKVEGGVKVVKHNSYYSPDFYKTLEIPNKVSYDNNTEYFVVGIDDGAFWDCTALQSVTIPNTVTEIGQSAFRNCRNLETVTIPNSVTKIGEAAFFVCKSLNTITIPESVKVIGDHAFNLCEKLETLVITDGVETIGYASFGDCDALKTLSIPDSVTRIGDFAFSHCATLENVKLPEHINFICEGTFFDCINLTKITIPGSVSKICVRAFYQCPNLSTVTILNGSVTLDQNAFQDCTGLTSLYIAIKKDSIGTPDTAGGNPFTNCPAGHLYLTADGKNPLDAPAFTTAKNAYDQTGDAQHDNGTDADGRWWDWIISEAPTPTTYTVTIKAMLDGHEWNESEHGKKTFALSKDDGKTYITDLTAVENGTYSIYEIIETPEQTAARAVSYVNTGISMTVDKDNTNAVVNYYTATFYDGSVLYDKKIVVENMRFDPPLPPTKDGHTFGGWKTRDGGDFNFEGGLAGEKDFFASWTAEEPEPDNPGGGGGGGDTDPDNPGGGGGSDPDDSDDDHSGGGTSDSGSGSGGSGGGSGSGGSGGGSDTGNSGDNNSGGSSTESTNLSADSSLPEAGASAKAADTVSNTNTNVSGSRPGEPKTGDASHLEVYASIAMIAGFVYLILYLMDGMKGMSEEEKNRRIAALLGWAKRGRAKTLRRYIAITAVFFMLAYYHAFGKRAALEWQKA